MFLNPNFHGLKNERFLTSLCAENGETAHQGKCAPRKMKAMLAATTHAGAESLFRTSFLTS
jgi:hypothetical protein